MPASSTGSLNSWAVYIIASAVLVLMFIPQLTGSAKYSRAAADWRDLDGVRSTIDALRPGMTAEVVFGSRLWSDPIKLAGHSVSCYDGNGTLSMAVRWLLPNYTLVPSSEYLVSLSLGSVKVDPLV